MTSADEAGWWCRRLASQVQDPELKRALAALAEDYDRTPELRSETSRAPAATTETASFEPASPRR